jgi:hypothetical protein
MTMTPKITVGTRVRYYQPGVNGILASWSGRPSPAASDGELRTVTVTKVTHDSATGMTFYDTAEGVMLEASDIREALS